VRLLADVRKASCRLRRFGAVAALPVVIVVVARGQVGAPLNPPQKFDKRAFGVIPNYRTADASAPFRPLTTGQKITIAAKDSFDWPPILTSAAYAGLGQLSNQTRNDSGGTRFNSSELLGNCIAVGISNAYYPDGRTAAANFGELCFQLGTDAVSNNLKEFWPDVKHRLLGRPANQQP
jgi:hypothetical protein